MDRSAKLFLLTGFGITPLALGYELPSFGIVPSGILDILGCFAVLASILLLRKEGRPQRRLDWIAGLASISYLFRIVEPWLPAYGWLTGLSFGVGLLEVSAYLLLALSGRAIAIALSDRSLERSWQACAWIGYPLLLVQVLSFALWWAFAGFPQDHHFELKSYLALLLGTLVLSAPAVLLLHALFASRKTMRVAQGQSAGPVLSVLASRWAAAGLLALFLAPALTLAPSAFYFATTSSFDALLADKQSRFSFSMPAGVRIASKETGLTFASPGWVDIDMESEAKKSERLGYSLSIRLSRPDRPLLELRQSLDVEVDPAHYDAFQAFRVSNDIKALDPMFRLVLRLFLEIPASPAGTSDEPVLKFLVQAALLSGPGEPSIEMIFVEGLESPALEPMMLDPGPLAYLWQARGSLALVASCRAEACLGPRVRYAQEQRFDLATEEYSFEMESAFAMRSITRGPGVQSSYTIESDIDRQSISVTWNDSAW